jgi:hypothetical protein
MAIRAVASTTHPAAHPDSPIGYPDFAAGHKQVVDLYGAPGMIRTCDLLVRSQTLYPTELRARDPYYSKGPVYFSRAGAAASAVFLSARILILRLILRFRWRP